MADDDYRWSEVIRRLTAMEGKLDNPNHFMTRMLYAAESKATVERMSAQENRLERIEDTVTWAFRMIIGAVFAIAVEAVVITMQLVGVLHR